MFNKLKLLFIVPLEYTPGIACCISLVVGATRDTRLEQVSPIPGYQKLPDFRIGHRSNQPFDVCASRSCTNIYQKVRDDDQLHDHAKVYAYV